MAHSDNMTCTAEIRTSSKEELKSLCDFIELLHKWNKKYKQGGVENVGRDKIIGNTDIAN